MITRLTKGFLITVMAVAVVGAIIMVVPASACNQQQGQGKCSDQCLWSLKEAKFEITNTATGVMVTATATAEKPEVVKAIQDRVANCGKHEHGGEAGVCKDAKFEVANTANGATITVTSDKSDVVKAIQEKFAGCAKHCQAKDPAACQSLHQSGKCAGHGPGR